MTGAAIKVADWMRCGWISGRALARAGLAAFVLAAALPVVAHAAPGDSMIDVPRVPAGEKMLVESDQLVYDYDNNTVAAVGNVKIYYGGYTLEAERVSYNKTSGRLIAFGHVKMVDPTGAAYYSDYIDITDDFAEGFVQSLRVDTAQRTHFAAESAEHGADTTTFNNGTYTACEPCKDNPEKPLFWNVRATKIVIDHKEHTVYFTNASLEFFGMPVAWLPYFSVPDPTVKRKSGFLTPGIGYADKLGTYVSTPYYWVLAPNRDITLTPTFLTRQGALGEAEYRHRLTNGQYTVRVAGIYQLDPDAFDATSPGHNRFRAGVQTTGEFYLNQDWTFGWNGTLTSDRTFTRDYGVLNKNTSETVSTVYLTGLRERNFFEARGSYYQILTNSKAPGLAHPERFAQARQPVVGEVDYKKFADMPVFGGELSFTSNLTALTRGEDDSFMLGGVPPTFTHGTAGNFLRATKQIDWQRRFIGPMGQVITPFASVRGDAFLLSGQSTAATGGVTSDNVAFRFMPTVGVDWSLPILATSPGATHIIEPRAQLILRPNETSIGKLPNNDAQSLVYDVSNLFDRDKFSGFDRTEGGSRLNVGLHYNGSFDNGAVIDATIGQSYHLAGTNSYAMADIAGVGGVTSSGIDMSGLASTASDYVAGVSLDSGLGPRVTASGRFDEANFNVKRAEIEATAALGPISTSTAYIYLRNNPYSDTLAEASVIRGAASVNISDNWRAFGTATYDIANTALASRSVGLAFDNECVTFAVAYSETRSAYTDSSTSRWLNFRVQLRTLGDSSLQTTLRNPN